MLAQVRIGIQQKDQVLLSKSKSIDKLKRFVKKIHRKINCWGIKIEEDDKKYNWCLNNKIAYKKGGYWKIGSRDKNERFVAKGKNIIID